MINRSMSGLPVLEIKVNALEDLEVFSGKCVEVSVKKLQDKISQLETTRKAEVMKNAKRYYAKAVEEYEKNKTKADDEERKYKVAVFNKKHSSQKIILADEVIARPEMNKERARKIFDSRIKEIQEYIKEELLVAI